MKMNTTAFSVRMDSDTKIGFETFCKSVGLTVSSAINLFAKTVVREKRIPFEIKGETDPFWSEENQSELLESIAAAKNGNITVREIYED